MPQSENIVRAWGMYKEGVVENTLVVKRRFELR